MMDSKRPPTVFLPREDELRTFALSVRPAAFDTDGQKQRSDQTL